VTDADPASAGAGSEPVGSAAGGWATAAPDALGDGLRRGVPQCLEECFRRWSPVVHTIALRALSDQHDADDVTQQVFVSAWQSRTQYQPAAGSLPSWLIGITQHRIADTRRASGRAARLVTAVSTDRRPGPPQPESETTVDRLLIATELHRLPHPRGAILRAVYFEGQTYQEIADRMQLPLGTVKSHARRALLTLHQRLQEVTA
jgi:RNA polymerase sigma-70 factor (ECF subfamily)